MTDDEFYKRDQTEDAALPEDRPREGALPSPSRGGKGVWVVLGIVVLFIIIFALILV
ncbi:hypothetical protein [Streptomyces sp. NPDC047841]|uniref:hypothetical protein n=1 Tax=Streptomyces sp. NPDC047841 TaxID=3154708 RepID=UPI0034564C98